MKIIANMAVALLAISAWAQSSPKASQTAQVFSAEQLRAQNAGLVQQAKRSGSSGATLGDYTTHKLMLSDRTKSGGAEVHAHFDDILVITDGGATLITGGTVMDPHTYSGGEIKGKRIENGKSQAISKGDIVDIPAGTPHQLLIAPGMVFSAFVVKVHE